MSPGSEQEMPSSPYISFHLYVLRQTDTEYPESKNVISSYCLGGLHWVMITEITISDKKYPVTVFYDGDMAQHSPNMLWRKLNPNFSLNGDVIIISDVILPFPSKKREENKKLILKQIHDLSQMLLVNEF